MSNESEPLPKINSFIKKSSITSSILNASNINNMNMNYSSDCDSIISYRDERNPEKKAFFDKIYKTKHDSKSILNIAKDLNSNIQGLDGKINSILNRHHKDYIASFNEFMDTVKKDLREKIDNLEKIDKEKKKSEDIDLLKTERDFFRQEAIRLNEMCKDLSLTNDDLIRENKYKFSELKHITKKWKDSENTNKQLLAELERNIKIIKNFENEKRQFLKFNGNNLQVNNKYLPNQNHKNYSSLYNFSSIYNSFENNSNLIKNSLANSDYYDFGNGKGNINNSGSFIQENNSMEKINNMNLNQNSNYHNINLNNSSSYNLHNNSTEDVDFTSNNYNSLIFDSQRDKDKIIKIIEKLKAELKKEKNRNHKIIGEFNKILLDKKKMEKIFMDCVEESRKEILQRRLRDTVHTKSGFFGSISKRSMQNLPIINEVKFENFQATDKRKLVESFLMRDEIINFIKENLVNILPENKGPYFQKNTLNESIFNFRQTILSKNDSKIIPINEFTKSKNSLRSSSKHNLELIK